MVAGGSVRLFTALWRALRSQSEVTLLSSRRRFDDSLAGLNGWSECHQMAHLLAVMVGRSVIIWNVTPC